MRLTLKEKSVIKLIKKDKSYANYFFGKYEKIKLFSALNLEGFFLPENNPSPIEVKNGYQIPEWNVLQYLEKISKKTRKLDYDLINIIKDVSFYKDENGKHIDNYRTWWYFVKILLNIPLSRIPYEIFEKAIPIWLISIFDLTLPGSDLANDLLPTYLNQAKNKGDIKKVEKLVELLLSVKEFKTKKSVIGEKATRTTADEIKTYLDSLKYNHLLDIDGDGLNDGGTDGVLIVRYLAGVSGDLLTSEAVSPNAKRRDYTRINNFITNCGSGCVSCIDSDGGKDVSSYGSVKLSGVLEGISGQGDWCDYGKGENKIYEAYCINQTDFVIELMDCPTDKPYCNKGKCTTSKPQCSEDDGGKNPLVLGTTFPSRMADHTGATDYCQVTSTGQLPESGECSGADCSLREFFCVKDSPDEHYEDIPCPSGCKEGVCRSIDPTKGTGPIEINESNEGAREEIKIIKEICNGCLLEDKCYPFNYRKSGEYCSMGKSFVKQLEADSVCENNFECESNVCVSGQCISGSFIQKVISWFSKMFG